MLTPKCIIKVPYSFTVIINIKSKADAQQIVTRTHLTSLSRQFYIAKYTHLHYRLLTYNDYLIQHRGLPADWDVQVLPIPANLLNVLTRLLITQLFQPISVSDQLLHVAQVLSPFNILEIYIDGSFSQTPDDQELPMGYGWTTAFLSPNNITHNGSLRYFPLSTKAEVMAILTALVILASATNITLYTDSQTAINTFHKSKLLSGISHHHFLKISNYTLWIAIHHVISILNLSVQFIKVKAHSNNTFNDLADTQAKIGQLASAPTELVLTHLPGHSTTLLWNDTIPLIGMFVRLLVPLSTINV